VCNVYACIYMFLTTRKAAWYIILVLSVCLSVSLYVCMSDDNFRKSGRTKFIFAHAVYVNEVRSSSNTKVIGSWSSLQEPKGRKFLIRQCKTSTGNNSGSIKHRTRAVKFARSMGIEWCDRYRCHVTGSEHA